MKTVKAFFNHGRWIVQCPKHGVLGAMPAEAEYICPVCHPKILATFVVLKDGKLQTIHDRSARRTAYLEAQAKGEIYIVAFPKQKDIIEKELSKLPDDKKHWNGESMQALKENTKRTAHVIKNFEKRNKKLDGNGSMIVVERGK